MSPGGGGVDVDIVINPRSAIKAFKDVEKAAQDMSKGVEGAVGRWESAVDHATKLSISVSNRAQQAQERYVRSIEQTAAAYGRTGADKLIAQRDQIIKRLGDEEKAVARVTAAYARMIKVEQERKPDAGGGHGTPMFLALRGVRDFAEGRTAYGEMMVGRALAGLSGAPLILGGIATAFVGVEAAGYKAAKAVAAYGMHVHDMQIKTGMSAVEVQKLDFAAKVTGNDISVMDRVMRGLTQALEGTDTKATAARATLQGMGVDSQALRMGLMSPMDVLQKVSGALENQPGLWLRNKEAIDLFNRAGIQSLPMLVELNRSLKTSEGINFIPEEQIRRFQQIHVELTKVGTEWDMFMLQLKSSLAQPFLITMRIVKAGASMGSDPLTSTTQAISDSVLWWFGDRSAATERLGQMNKFATSGGLSIHTPTPAERYSRGLIGTDAEATSREAQRLRKELDEMLSTGMVRNPGQSERLATVTDIQSATAAYKQMEASSKAIQKTEADRLSNLEAIRKLVIDAAERTAHPYGMLQSDRELKSFLERPGITSTQSAEARALLAPVAHAEVLDNLRKAGLMVAPDGRIVRSNINPIWGGIGGTSEGLRDIVLEKDVGHTAMMSARNQQLLSGTKRQESEDREALRPMLQIVAEQRRNEEAAALRNVAISGALVPSTITSRLAAESQIAEIKKRAADQEAHDAESRLAKPRHFLSVETVNYENELFAIRLKHEGEVAAARQQYQEQYLQEVRKQLDAIKGTASSLFMTLFTHPNQFGAQLGTTLRNAILTPMANGLGERVAQGLHPTIFGQGGTTGIAGQLRNLFSGGGVGSGTQGMQSATPTSSPSPAPSSSPSYDWVGFPHGPLIGGLGRFPSLPGFDAGGIGGGVVSGNGGGGGGYSASTSTSDLAMGGTPPFMAGGGTNGVGGGGWGGGSGLSGLSGIFGGKGGFRGILSNLKGSLGGLTRSGGGMYSDATDAEGNDVVTGGREGSKITGVSGTFGQLLQAGGFALASHGLLGNARGTWSGTIQGAAGGAMIGMKYGGPLGAAIGAAVGFGIGVGEQLAGVESPLHQVQRLVKEIYHISISNSTAEQIIAIAKDKYGGQNSLAVRSPEVRQMLGLYAAGTGQASMFAQGSSTPHGSSLIESGGMLSQGRTYQYGNAYTYASSLPVYGEGGGGGGTYPSPGGGGMSLALNISGKDAGRFMQGELVTPEFVGHQYTAALNASAGRMQNSLMLQAPGDSIG